MNMKIVSGVLLATTGLALGAASPAHAQADCPQRIELLKQFAEGGSLDQASKKQINDLALEGVESQEACERAVAELQKRLNVEVRGGEVLPLDGQQSGTAANAASGSGSTGSQGQPQTGSQGQSQTGSQGQSQTGSQQSAAGQGQSQTSGQQGGSQQGSGQASTTASQQETTIGGGLDMPREQIEAKYGPLAWVTFGEIIGAEVVGPAGDPIAEIIALVRDRSSDDFYAVLDAGTREDILVPIDQLEIAEGDRIGFYGESGELQNMPAYDQDRYQTMVE